MPLLGDGVRSGTFKPIEDLQRTDGDTYLVFLIGNGVPYWGNVTDPWYQAHGPGPVLANAVGDLTKGIAFYTPDEAASPLACVEQFQYCNTAYPRDVGCGPLSVNTGAAVGSLGLFNTTVKEIVSGDTTSEAVTTLNWFITQQDASPMLIHVLGNLGAHALASRSTLYRGVQEALPENQWQLNATRLWATTLAGLQAMYEQGHTDPGLAAVQVGP